MKRWEYWWLNIDDYREEAKEGIERLIKDVKSSQIWSETDTKAKERLIQDMKHEKFAITEDDIKMYVTNYWGDLGWELVSSNDKQLVFKRELEPEWEYIAGYLNKDFVERYELETEFKGKSTDFDALFNELGADGWELSGLTADQNGKFAVFKRRYVEDDDDEGDDEEFEDDDDFYDDEFDEV